MGGGSEERAKDGTSGNAVTRRKHGKSGYLNPQSPQFQVDAVIVVNSGVGISAANVI